MQTRIAEMTKLPKVFKKFYWGCWIFEDDPRWKGQMVFENRNKFVDEFGIYRAMDTVICRGSLYGYDHPECYSCRDGKVVYVISPYEKGEPDNRLWRFGFKKYNSLYMDGVNTWIAVFRNKAEYQGVLKAFLAVNQ
jgi:hypothetical protein